MIDFDRIFSDYFTNCIFYSLIPPPWDDRKTNKLLDCAVSCLGRVLKECNITDKIYDITLMTLSRSHRAPWLSKTDDERFELFYRYQAAIHSGFKEENEQKHIRKEEKKYRKSRIKSGEISDNDTEICANCFVSEKDIKKEGKTLLKCSACKQIA